MAQVGAPGVLRQGGRERLPDALRVAGGQPGGGGGLRRLGPRKLSHNAIYQGT